MSDIDFWKNKVSKLECECVNKQNEINELKSECEKIHKQLMETEKDAQEKISKLETELEEWQEEARAVKRNRDEMLANFRKGIEPYVDLQDMHEKISELEDRHQQDCITINQLNVTIDVLLDKIERLRNNKYMALKCISGFTQ